MAVTIRGFLLLCRKTVASRDGEDTRYNGVATASSSSAVSAAVRAAVRAEHTHTVSSAVAVEDEEAAALVKCDHVCQVSLSI